MLYVFLLLRFWHSWPPSNSRWLLLEVLEDKLLLLEPTDATSELAGRYAVLQELEFVDSETLREEALFFAFVLKHLKTVGERLNPPILLKYSSNKRRTIYKTDFWLLSQWTLRRTMLLDVNARTVCFGPLSTRVF